MPIGPRVKGPVKVPEGFFLGGGGINRLIVLTYFFGLTIAFLIVKILLNRKGYW